jgi:hypothetical protein
MTLTGSTNADAITGGDVADNLTGGAGNDTISGGAGNDTITGGAGNDTISGGLGSDTFIFEATAGTTDVNNGADTITDFTSGTTNGDVLKLAAMGTFAALDAGSTTITGAINATVAGAAGTTITNKIVFIDTINYADLAAVTSALATTAAANKFGLGDNGKAVMLFGNTLSSNTELKAYLISDSNGTAAGIVSAITLIGTLSNVDATSFVAANFA